VGESKDFLDWPLFYEIEISVGERNLREKLKREF
jgi:hypothetical protein